MNINSILDISIVPIDFLGGITVLQVCRRMFLFLGDTQWYDGKCLTTGSAKEKKKALVCSTANFHGVNAGTIADFKQPT